MFDRNSVKEGMVVRSADGEKLGKVFAVSGDTFHIEKGLFFPKDYVARCSDIADIRGGELILVSGRDVLRGEHAAGTAGTSVGGVSERRTEAQDVTIPVAREELEVVKRERQAGEVRVKKDVITEQREIDVPVRKEQVRVERRAVEPGRHATSSAFQEETVVVPLTEEEVDVRKRVVTDEEVVIRKDAVEQERRVAETVRREEVDVRTDGDLGRTGYQAPDTDPLKRR